MQRLSLGLATLALICCLAMLVFVWQSSQAVIASQSAQREMLMALEERLSQLGTGEMPSNQPTEWNNLTIKLIYDDEAKTPVEGAEVHLDGKSPTNEQLNGYHENTDAKGAADFGLLLYGSYTVDVTLPSGIVCCNREVVIRPGQDKFHEIVCPTTNYQEVDVAPIQLPEVYPEQGWFEGKNIWYMLEFQRQSTMNTVREWHNPEYSSVLMLAGPEGVVSDPEIQKQLNTPLDILLDSKTNEFGEITDPGLNQLSRYPTACWKLSADWDPQQTARLPLGHYVSRGKFVAMLIEKEHAGERFLVGAPQIPFFELTRRSGGERNLDLGDIVKWDSNKEDAFETLVSTHLPLTSTDEFWQVSTQSQNPMTPIFPIGEPLRFWLAEQMPSETALALTNVASKSRINEIGPQSVQLYAHHLGADLRPNQVTEAPATILLAKSLQRAGFIVERRPTLRHRSPQPTHVCLVATDPEWIIGKSAKYSALMTATTYDPRQAETKSKEASATTEAPE